MSNRKPQLRLWDAIVDYWRYWGLQRRIGYRFKDIKTLNTALTHPSLDRVNNQRLEFLGDAVLELVVSEFLFKEYPQVNEGTLTQLKIMSVNNVHLKSVAIHLQLEEYLLVGHGLNPNVNKHDKIHADAVEAVIGAIYIDGGLRPARRFVNKYVLQTLPTLEETQMHPKTALQNWARKQGFAYPEYEVVVEPHTQGAIEWTVKCSLKQLAIYRSAKARSRKEAERLAAEQILFDLGVYSNGM